MSPSEWYAMEVRIAARERAELQSGRYDDDSDDGIPYYNMFD